MTVVAIGGWVAAALALAGLLTLRRRLRLVALALHEVRGPATAIALVIEPLRREPAGAARAGRFEAQLERLRAGLSDLEAAAHGRRAQAHPVVLPAERMLRSVAAGWGLRFTWDGGPAPVRADSGRLARLFCNLVDNAVEHGDGEVEVAGRRIPGGVRVEIRNAGAPGAPGPGRGLGLGLAAAAAREAGGRLDLSHADGTTVAAVELPVAEQ